MRPESGTKWLRASNHESSANLNKNKRATTERIKFCAYLRAVMPRAPHSTSLHSGGEKGASHGNPGHDRGQ